MAGSRRGSIETDCIVRSWICQLLPISTVSLLVLWLGDGMKLHRNTSVRYTVPSSDELGTAHRLQHETLCRRHARKRPAIDATGHDQTRLNALGLKFELIDIPVGRDESALEEGSFGACQPN